MRKKSPIFVICILLVLIGFGEASFNDLFLCGAEGEAALEDGNGTLTCLKACPTVGQNCNCTRDEHCQQLGAVCVNGHCDCFALGRVPSRDGRTCLPYVGGNQFCHPYGNCEITSEFDQLFCDESTNFPDISPLNCCRQVNSTCFSSSYDSLASSCNPEWKMEVALNYCAEKTCKNDSLCKCPNINLYDNDEHATLRLEVENKQGYLLPNSQVLSCPCPYGYVKPIWNKYQSYFCYKIQTKIGGPCRTSTQCVGRDSSDQRVCVFVYHDYSTQHTIARCATADKESLHCLLQPGLCYLEGISGKNCSSYDGVGKLWTGIGNSIAYKSCQREYAETWNQDYTAANFVAKEGIDKVATWYCQLNGEFAPDGPDYTNCTSPWLVWVESRINGSISIDKALDLLSVVDKNILLYANKSYSLVYAHELDRVFSAVNRVADSLSLYYANEKNPNELVKLVGSISKSALSSLTPWKSVSEENKSQAFTQFIKMVDTTPTVITEKIIGAGIEVAPTVVSSKPFQFTVTPAKCQRNEELIIESGGDPGSSIKLRIKCTAENTTFTQARSRIAGEVAYSIGQAYIRHGDLKVSHFSLNSDIEGLTLSDKVDIIGIRQTLNQSFSHYLAPCPIGEAVVDISNVGYSFGSRILNLRRRLHEDEVPSGVASTTVCAWFDSEKGLWSTEGCYLQQTSGWRSICKCRHLTSFATLIRRHNYIGKSVFLSAVLFLFLVGWALWFTWKLVRYKMKEDASLTLHSKSFQKLGIVLTYFCYVFIIFFVDKHWIPSNPRGCYHTGCLAHFFVLASIAILSVETLAAVNSINCFPVIGIFTRKVMEKPIWAYVGLPAGFGILIVVITVIFDSLDGVRNRAYGGEFCWLDGPYINALYVPLGCLILINVTVLVFLLWRATGWVDSGMKEVVTPNGKRFVAKDVFDTVKDGLVCNILILVTWIIGYFSLGPTYVDSEVMSWIFPFLLALQGALYNIVLERLGFIAWIKKVVVTKCVAPILRKRMGAMKKMNAKEAAEEQERVQMNPVSKSATRASTSEAK